jgi:probable HAF family extracellular repeat protein
MRDRIRCIFSVVVISLLLLVSGSGPVATANPLGPTYTLIDLGTLGGPLGSEALGINARGQVVGYAGTAAGQTHAFLWEAGTGMQDLGAGVAQGINARGQIVGGDSGRAVLWEPGSE